MSSKVDLNDRYADRPLVVPMYQTPQTPMSNFQSANRGLFGAGASGSPNYGGMFFRSKRREMSSLDDVNSDGETMRTIVSANAAIAPDARVLTISSACSNCMYMDETHQ
jgi:hypothetical protein